MMEFPGRDQISNPLTDLRYEISINAKPVEIWPWIKQMGYHRGGWYIDTWWDKFTNTYFWPLIVPKEARPVFKPPADEILPKYQELLVGDIIPDGPPESAYYDVIEMIENQLLLLYATTHFNYMAPKFVYQTKYAPRGAFCWAFILTRINEQETKLISWWQSEAEPRKLFSLVKPVFQLIDGAHQRAILKGIKKRAKANIAI